MNPEKIANWVVSEGVGEKTNQMYRIAPSPTPTLSADDFIRDGRVVLAMMARLRKQGYSFLLANMPDGKALMTITSPLPNRKKWDAQIVDDDDAIAILTAIYRAKNDG